GRQRAARRAKADGLQVQIAVERARAKAAANATPKGPSPGSIRTEVAQPCTVEPFESVRLFARVPGFLKSQSVDIGDRVKRGQILAELEVPDLEAQLRQDQAALDQSHARPLQAKTRIQERGFYCSSL